MPSHYEETLERDMQRIRAKVEEMGQLAESALTGCLRSLSERNRQLAYSVILRDSRLDELEKQVDRLCLEFIVRQQPVAGTLRFAYAAMKINAELERVGDYAESMARQILTLEEIPDRTPLDRITQIADLVVPMLKDAVTSFLTSDADLARNTRSTEAVVDKLRHQISNELVTLREDRKIPLEALTPLLHIVNRFERTADQATNVCQEVIYMCTGEYAKHKGTEVYRVLFVDEHQSCRALMAQAIGNQLAQPKFIFVSAGLDPQPTNPRTTAFLASKGIEDTRTSLLPVDHVPNFDHFDLIVALAESARSVFPPPPTKTVCLDWSIRDPSTVEGPEEEVQTAYDRAYEYLRSHITDLVEAILGDEPG